MTCTHVAAALSNMEDQTVPSRIVRLRIHYHFRSDRSCVNPCAVRAENWQSCSAPSGIWHTNFTVCVTWQAISLAYGRANEEHTSAQAKTLNTQSSGRKQRSSESFVYVSGRTKYITDRVWTDVDMSRQQALHCDDVACKRITLGC
jgi:hypothetical protein